MTTPTIPFYPVTHDDGTNIVSALNSIASARRTPLLIADAFSNLTNYDVNDYVIYENNLYRFTASHPAGSWNYSQVVRVSLGEELERKVDNSAVAPEFRDDVNYAVGDVVSYKGGLYRYLSPHIEGDWDRSEVVATNVISEGGGGGGGTGVGDEITFDGDNMIITSSGRSIESLESSIAIVANGDTHPLINQGEYVYVKMHNTLPEGLYTANSNIVEDGALTTSNLSSVSKGGFNKTVDITHGGTGASDIVNARKNLGYVGMFFSQAVFAAECIRVPRNSNLNTLTYTATGKYYVPLNTDVATMSNVPSGEAFQMLVYNLLGSNTGQLSETYEYRTRILMTFTGAIFIQFIEKNNDNIAYGVWKRISVT